MCDLEKDFKKIVLSSDLSDEEKIEQLRIEAEKESIVDYLYRHPELGVSFEELGLTEEDFLNAPTYEVSEDEGKQQYSKEDFDAKPTPLYRYESFVYGASGYGKNSRRFCVEVASRTRTSAFRYVDILKLNGSNPGFGSGGSNIYSVFRFRGGSNCRHFWTKYYYDPKKRELVKAPAGEQPNQIHKGKMPPPKK